LEGAVAGAMKHAEYQIQCALVTWCDSVALHYPDVALYVATDPAGQRTPQAGARRKRMGVRAGVPDLFWPVARGDCHGLWIELKAPGGRPTPAQLHWLDVLGRQGYGARLCVGLREAVDVVSAYFGVPVSWHQSSRRSYGLR
jgi:hypothetical protein